MIRVGLAGYGLAGATFHAPLIRACEAMNLSAIFTSREVADAVRTLDELLARSDLVVVATPNSTHFDIARRALRAGKHVVVDKPFTVTVAEADELIALADQCDRKLTVFHNRRWDGDFLTVRSILPQLGEIQLFEAYWDRFRPAVRAGWKEAPQDGTGLLADLGSHLIDQALELFGSPDSLHADIAIQRPEARVDDYFALTLQLGAMRVVLGASTLIAEPRPRFAVHGTEGSFLRFGVDRQEQQLKDGVNPRSESFGSDVVPGLLTRPGSSTEKVQMKQGAYLTFYNRLADALLGHAQVPVHPSEARQVMNILELARQSAREGRRVVVRTDQPSASQLAAS
jgi:scyllo-inositol 2-dehydrogenase (NADP+)